MNPKTPTRKEIEELIDRLATPDTFDGFTRVVRIGEVLNKIQEQDDKSEHLRWWIEIAGGGFIETNFDDPDAQDTTMDALVKLWSKLGFSKSLQQVFLETEWEQAILSGFPISVGTPEKSEPLLLAKPSPHSDLFSFLLTLGL